MKSLLRTGHLLRGMVVAISVVLLLAAAGSAQERWQIVRAEYGTGDRWTDVTHRVQSLVRNGSLDFRVSHDSMDADPAEGQRKSLRLVLRNGGGLVREFTFPDNKDVHLLITDNGVVPFIPGLQINSAQYGAFHMVDVTARLASLVQGDHLSVVISHNTMNADPDEGRTKHIVVNYTYNGAPGQVQLRDGETLNLPGPGVGYPVGGGNGAYGALSILRAEYGTGSRVIDVTNRLNAQVQGNSLQLRVTNDSMGGDPAHEEAKWLDVWYTYNNRAGHANVHEKDVLILPGTGDANYYQGRLQVTRAQYGADSRFADVTSLLNSRIQNDSLSMRVDHNSMQADPAEGERKVLTVLYVYNGHQARAFVNDNDILTLPVQESRGDRDDDDDNYYHRFWPGRSESELRVLQASWGSGGQQRDMTGRLNQLVQGNRLNLNVNDDSMGGDPAPGAEKRLRVLYMYRGLRYETNVPEGGVLSLP